MERMQQQGEVKNVKEEPRNEQRKKGQSVKEKERRRGKEMGRK